MKADNFKNEEKEEVTKPEKGTDFSIPTKSEMAEMKPKTKNRENLVCISKRR